MADTCATLRLRQRPWYGRIADPLRKGMRGLHCSHVSSGRAVMIKRIVLPLLYIGLATFVALCAVLYLLQGQLIFLRPSLADEDRHAVRLLPGTTEVRITAHDGTRLHGWLRHTVEEPHSRGLVIYFGGNAEEVSGQMHDAPMLAPWSVAAVNYRGYGMSEGRPSEAALAADALAIHDRLAEREDIDPDRIVVFGRSLGSGVAVRLAAARPVRAVVLVSPFDSLRSIARKQYPIVPVSLLLKHPFDSLAHAAGIEAPLLVIAGEQDDLIPPAYSRRLHDAWPGPKRWVLVADADHNDIHAKPGYWPAIREFLALPGPAP